MLKSRFPVLPFKASRLGIVSCIVSVIVHGIVIILFFVPNKQTQTLQLVLGQHRIADLPIQFVSTAHSIPGALQRVAQLQTKSLGSALKKNETNNGGPTTTINKIKPMEKKQAIQKQISKENPKKRNVKKEEEKKVIKDKQKKQSEQKIAEAKKDVPKKIESPKEQKKEIISPITQNVKEIVSTQSPAERNDMKINSDAALFDASKPIAIGQQEYDALCLYAVIQEEIERSWCPPAGIKPPRGCTIKIVVDSNGNVANALIQESSTIITYDIAARMALLQTSLPREVAGKELVITFQL